MYSLIVPQKVKELPCDPAIPFLGMHPKEQNSNTYSYASVHSNIIHKSQKMETMPVSINR